MINLNSGGFNTINFNANFKAIKRFNYILYLNLILIKRIFDRFESAFFHKNLYDRKTKFFKTNISFRFIIASLTVIDGKKSIIMC